MRNVHHSPEHLNTQSLWGGAVQGVLGDVTLLEEVCLGIGRQGWTLQLEIFITCSLLSASHWDWSLRCELPGSHPSHQACFLLPHPLPRWTLIPSLTGRQNKLSSLSRFWSLCFIPATEKKLIRRVRPDGIAPISVILERSERQPARLNPRKARRN